MFCSYVCDYSSWGVVPCIRPVCSGSAFQSVEIFLNCVPVLQPHLFSDPPAWGITIASSLGPALSDLISSSSRGWSVPPFASTPGAGWRPLAPVLQPHGQTYHAEAGEAMVPAVQGCSWFSAPTPSLSPLLQGQWQDGVVGLWVLTMTLPLLQGPLQALEKLWITAEVQVLSICSFRYTMQHWLHLVNSLWCRVSSCRSNINTSINSTGSLSGLSKWVAL